MITHRDGKQVAQAWFHGLNPLLGDRAPARLLREGDLETVGPQVLTAARHWEREIYSVVFACIVTQK